MNSHPPAPETAPPAPRPNWTRRLVNLLVALVVVAVAAATFVFSYAGVHAIALLGGVSVQLARYYPGLFDAVLVIACVAALMVREGRWWARLWAWLVAFVMLGAIGVADVLHAMNYALRPRPTEGIVAAAPVVAVLLAFSLLLTMLRHSRSLPQGAERAKHGYRGGGQESVPGTLDLPGLSLPASGAEAPTLETPALAASSQFRPPAPPIALPAAFTPPPPVAEAAVPIPALGTPAADPSVRTAPEAPTAAAPSLSTAPAVPTAPAAVQAPAPAAPPVTDGTEPAGGAASAPAATPGTAPDVAPAREERPLPGIGGVEPPTAFTPAVPTAPTMPTPPEASKPLSPTAPGEAATEPTTTAAPLAAAPFAAAPLDPSPDAGQADSVPPHVATAAAPAAAAPVAQPPTVPVPARRPAGIRYAGRAAPRSGRPATEQSRAEQPGTERASTGRPATERGDGEAEGGGPESADYWDAEEAGPYAGLVYPVRDDEQADAEDGRTDQSHGGEPPVRRLPPELDDDAPPFATAPFAPVPRLNRVRSMPVPPADDEE